jgi:ADP-heptose:LPS heptosyltransferase
MAENQQHILVYRLSSMGDVAMTVPVLALLLLQNPNLKLTVISRPEFEALFRQLPRTAFFSVDTKENYKGLLGIFKLSVAIAKIKPNYIADLHNVLRTKILKFFLKFWLTVPTKSIEKGRGDKKKLCANDPQKNLYQLKTTFERYADVFRSLGFKIDLNADMSNRQLQMSHRSMLLFSKSENRTAIGIAPFARYAAKTYPLQLMQKVLTLLFVQYPNIHIYLFGGKSDLVKLQQLKTVDQGKITIVANELDLFEELELMSNLKLILSMDSANMHLASMLGVPVVSLWGATHPFLGFYGWRQNQNNAICADRIKYPTLPSSVNGSKVHPGTEKCMETIDPMDVVKKIIENLKDAAFHVL